MTTAVLVITPKFVNCAGLLLDIFGVLLIYFFALPNKLVHAGSYVETQASDEEMNAMRKFDRRAKIGVGLLVFGFVLQLLSNLLPTSQDVPYVPDNQPTNRQGKLPE